MEIIEAAEFRISFMNKAIDLFIERHIIILCNILKYIACVFYYEHTEAHLRRLRYGRKQQ